MGAEGTSAKGPPQKRAWQTGVAGRDRCISLDPRGELQDLQDPTTPNPGHPQGPFRGSPFLLSERKGQP